MKYYRVRKKKTGEVLDLAENIAISVNDPNAWCLCDSAGCPTCQGKRVIRVSNMIPDQEGELVYETIIFVGPSPMYGGVLITRCPPGAAVGAGPW